MFTIFIYISKVNKISLKDIRVSNVPILCYIVLINMVDFENSIWRLIQSRTLSYIM